MYIYIHPLYKEIHVYIHQGTVRAQVGPQRPAPQGPSAKIEGYPPSGTLLVGGDAQGTLRMQLLS